MLIIVNPRANGGRSGERWPRVERALRDRGLRFETILTNSEYEIAHRIPGHDVVVAAGGDGTVNAVVNSIVPFRATLGAIGLGSSNDFHKPFSPDRTIEGTPIRILMDKTHLVDLGHAVWTDGRGTLHSRYFCLNASVGMLAEGNAFFNTADPTLRWLKRHHVDAAILYAALVNLVRFRPVRAALYLDGARLGTTRFSNLGVLKHVHITGGMRYDAPVKRDDGAFAIAVSERTQRASIVRTMANLMRGRFTGLPGAHCWRAQRIRIEPDRPVHLELDGEVSKITQAELTVLPRALRVCG